MFYNDLSFNEFNTTNIKNKVNAKYSTKNKTTEAVPVFLATKNQMSASAISRRNLKPIATSEKNVWLRGCFSTPMANSRMLRYTISAKSDGRIRISEQGMLIFAAAVIAYPAAVNTIVISMSGRI